VASDHLFMVGAVLMGAIMGSFMNVLIYRMPRGESVVGGRSRCPQCKRTVAAWDNIPILSWLLLRGRCRNCAWKIPARYLAVELISAAAAGVMVWYYGLTLQAGWMWAFVAIMTVITFIDWEHQIIPDPLSIGGVALGWVGAIICLEIDLPGSIIGSVVGGGIILLIAVVYKAVRKVHGMGGGDVKLMAMIGAFLGWQMVMPVLFVAAFFGSIYGLFLMRSRDSDGKTAVAFGSFLAPAACVMMFVGQPLLTWYLGLMPR